MPDEKRLDALVLDFRSVAERHGATLERHADSGTTSRYVFKLSATKEEVDIEKVFVPTINGPIDAA